MENDIWKIFHSSFSISHFSLKTQEQFPASCLLPPALRSMQPKPKLIIDRYQLRASIRKQTALAQEHGQSTSGCLTSECRAGKNCGELRVEPLRHAVANCLLGHWRKAGRSTRVY